MASNWEKPGYEIVMLGAECTAYSGAATAMQRLVIGSATAGAASGVLDRPKVAPSCDSRSEQRPTPVEWNGSPSP
jgi:coenzyme PQQ precursor peptide PqqA